MTYEENFTTDDRQYSTACRDMAKCVWIMSQTAQSVRKPSRKDLDSMEYVTTDRHIIEFMEKRIHVLGADEAFEVSCRYENAVFVMRDDGYMYLAFHSDEGELQSSIRIQGVTDFCSEEEEANARWLYGMFSMMGLEYMFENTEIWQCGGW